MTKCDTYTATIYVGLREGYNGAVRDIEQVYQLCRSFCDRVGLCVTVTATNFIYTGGEEPGAIIGLINYPRFPLCNTKIRELALVLAAELKVEFRQNRVSVVCSDQTFMIGEMA